MSKTKTTPGICYLVGAGPGDPGLLTLRGKECIELADVLVYDYLSNPELLRFAKPGAEKIYVGKKAKDHTLSQEDINQLIVEKTRAGKIVTRLKGGDPVLFGRGAEEAQELADAGVAFEIVPGVTSAIAGPAYAGIPVTHRSHASQLTIFTGHEDPDQAGKLARLREDRAGGRHQGHAHGRGAHRGDRGQAHRARREAGHAHRAHALGHDGTAADRRGDARPPSRRSCASRISRRPPSASSAPWCWSATS